MGEMYMPDSPNGGYRPLPKRECIVETADDGDRSLFIVRPEDVREAIVRCKDCKHMHTVRSWLGMDVDECWLHADPESGALGKERTEPNGFCKWGERRGA